MKIYFLGSGDIAVPVLRACIQAESIDVAGVGTQPDRAAGRKGKLSPTPVGKFAAESGFDADKPENVNAPDFLQKLHSINPDVILVVSFGQLLRQDLLSLPKYGCVNVHASLLPRYRGASPIVQALLNGDNATGICFMNMERGLDTGAVYRTLTMPLNGDEYADTLEIALGELAGKYVEETLHGIANGTYQPEKQDENKATLCTKTRKDESWIDWQSESGRIAAMVRAYHPWPGARCAVRRGNNESTVTLRKVKVRPDINLAPGEINIPDRRTILVGCRDCALQIIELTPQNSKTMDAVSFINGLRGETLEFLLRDI